MLVPRDIHYFMCNEYIVKKITVSIHIYVVRLIEAVLWTDRYVLMISPELTLIDCAIVDVEDDTWFSILISSN